MKKICILFLFLFVSPLIVNASDKIVIDNYDTYINAVGDNTYYYYDTYNTKITSEGQRNTFYFIATIAKTGKYLYRGNEYTYTNEIGVIDVKSAHNYFFLSDNDNDLVYLGTDVRFFSKEDVVKFSYDVKQVGDKLKYSNDINLIVAQSNYDINKVTFKIVLPEDSKRMKVSFSIDGINYYSGMNPLDYTYEDNVIDGEYTDTIKSGSKLYVRLDGSPVIDYKEITIISLMIIILIILIYILKSGIFKSNKSVDSNKKI